MDIVLEQIDAWEMRVHCDAGIAMELHEYFAFESPNAKFDPRFQNRLWDGKIRIFNYMTHTMPAGLAGRVREFARDREYTFQGLPAPEKISPQQVQDFITDCEPAMEPHYYQKYALFEAVNRQRALLISPTSSGKSFMIWLMCMWFLNEGHKVLITCTTTQLVSQLDSDFADYNTGLEYTTYQIMDGAKKRNDADITISTWHSIWEQPTKWFNPFGAIIGDECHMYKAKCLSSIMKKAKKTQYRIGLTGTLDGSETNEAVLEGHFGPVKVIKTTSELVDEGFISKPNISCIVLKYHEAERFAMRKKKYPDEISFLISHPHRNEFIKNLAMTRDGNTLVLFGHIDHGKHLYDIIRRATHQPVDLIYGGTEVEDREAIRALTEQRDNGIIIASYGTFSTGVNIRRLHNVIFAHPTKSRIRTLQSIGRGLRLAADKSACWIFDVADDLQYGSWRNHTLKHFIERVGFYDSEGHDYSVKNFTIRPL